MRLKLNKMRTLNHSIRIPLFKATSLRYFSKMGETSEGIKLKSVEELWDVELGKNGEKRIDWYGKATEYWNVCFYLHY